MTDPTERLAQMVSDIISMHMDVGTATAHLTAHGFGHRKDHVREETERIAKIMCEQCSQGIPLEDGGRFHHPVSDAHVAPRYLRRCDAAAIRAHGGDYD